MYLGLLSCELGDVWEVGERSVAQECDLCSLRSWFLAGVAPST